MASLHPRVVYLHTPSTTKHIPLLHPTQHRLFRLQSQSPHHPFSILLRRQPHHHIQTFAALQRALHFLIPVQHLGLTLAHRTDYPETRCISLDTLRSFDWAAELSLLPCHSCRMERKE